MTDPLKAARKDVVAGALLLVLAGLYYWQARQIQQSTLSDEVGPQGLPFVLAAALAVIAGLIALKGLVALARTVSQPPTGASEQPGDHVASLPRALGFLAIGVGYIVIGPIVGYIAGLSLLIVAVAVYERAPLDWQTVAVAIGIAVLFWLLFVKLLGTEQPVAWFLR